MIGKNFEQLLETMEGCETSKTIEKDLKMQK
jgi:hypothetical protein